MKKHIKLILRTLISNNACVEAARTKEKKYNIISIVFVLFALFFAAMPTCITGYQQQGGAFLKGDVTYAFDTGMEKFRETAETNNVTFDMKNHKLEAENWTSMATYNYDQPGDEQEYPTVKRDKLHCFVSVSKNTPSEYEEHKRLEIFYCPEGEDFNTYVQLVSENYDPEGYFNAESKETLSDYKNKIADHALQYKMKDDKAVKISRSTSFIVFGAKEVYGAIYCPGNTNVLGIGFGDYGYIDNSDDLITKVLVKDEVNPTAACAEFFDKAYINPRRAATWKSTGIILGVDAGVVLLMGLMVFILTRGKNNPFRIYSFWDGQKIAYYASLTPGILSLFGFLIPNMAMMLFILTVGVRVMWLSMRTLRYQAPAKA